MRDAAAWGRQAIAGTVLKTSVNGYSGWSQGLPWLFYQQVRGSAAACTNRTSTARIGRECRACTGGSPARPLFSRGWQSARSHSAERGPERRPVATQRTRIARGAVARETLIASQCPPTSAPSPCSRLRTSSSRQASTAGPPPPPASSGARASCARLPRWPTRAFVAPPCRASATGAARTWAPADGRRARRAVWP